MNKLCNFIFRLKDVEDRNPVCTSRFHADVKTFMLNKPVFEIIEVIVKRREIFLNILSDMSFLISNANSSNNNIFVNLKTSTIETVILNIKNFFQKRKSSIVSLQNIIKIDKNNLKYEAIVLFVCA